MSLQENDSPSALSPSESGSHLEAPLLPDRSASSPEAASHHSTSSAQLPKQQDAFQCWLVRANAECETRVEAEACGLVKEVRLEADQVSGATQAQNARLEGSDNIRLCNGS